MAVELLSRLRAASTPAAQAARRPPRLTAASNTEESMDHSKHVPLTDSEITKDTLTGAPIYDSENARVGTISHIHGTGDETEVVIDVGGFFGIASKPVLVKLNQISLMRDESGAVHGVTSWSKEELKELPRHHD
jgi:hypothetical protein